MKAVIGIDLGSTTSKALILNEQGQVAGKGITNSRSNYDVAVDVARTEAVIQARFNFLESRLLHVLGEGKLLNKFTGALATEFRIEQYRHQLTSLESTIGGFLNDTADGDALRPLTVEIFTAMREKARSHFRFGSKASSFFRDIAGSDYMDLAQDHARRAGIAFDKLANLFDKSIIIVENRGLDVSFKANIHTPFQTVLERFTSEVGDKRDMLLRTLEEVVDEPMDFVGQVGTGYGRQRLPFEKEEIRSEILCHGLGAHRMFPLTRTVLDIGGQDTKAIQVDESGIVTSFQMNDRCAAGCGRYLGYIADEMNLGLHELGPLADQATRTVRINSTCTVFAGAELRDRLTLGEKREDILAGLHRAIILRAMSLLARSGGIKDQFTFTGGVANNSAAVRALKQLVQENYGDIHTNISPDSIFTGALGAATFAYRDAFGQEMAA